MSEQITIQQLIEKTTDLPTFSTVALKVMREVERPDASSFAIARTLAQDAALSARVLRLANSAYYGLSRQVTSLTDAIVILGMRCVKNLCLVAATYPWLSRPLNGYALEPRALWIHSHGTALGAQAIAQRTRLVRDDAAFTAGLLHDIGKIALNAWLEHKTTAIVKIAEAQHWSFVEAERHILGFDHCQVGAFLAERWNLPPEIILCAAYHHEPQRCPNPSPILDCVHIGNALALSLGLGVGADGLNYGYHGASAERLGLTPTDLEQLADDLQKDFLAHERVIREIAA